MKIVEVVPAKEKEMIPFLLSDFTENTASSKTMTKMSKKELKALAESLGLAYDEAQIVFTKKLFNAYLRGKR